MSLVSVTRDLLAEKLFEAKIDQTQLSVNTAGQIIRALVLAVLVAFCLGALVKSKPHAGPAAGNNIRLTGHY